MSTTLVSFISFFVLNIWRARRTSGLAARHISGPLRRDQDPQRPFGTTYHPPPLPPPVTVHAERGINRSAEKTLSFLHGLSHGK